MAHDKAIVESNFIDSDHRAVRVKLSHTNVTPFKQQHNFKTS